MTYYKFDAYVLTCAKAHTYSLVLCHQNQNNTPPMQLHMSVRSAKSHSTTLSMQKQIKELGFY